MKLQIALRSICELYSRHKYIDICFSKEVGITVVDDNHFKKDNKAIRNLSQISYRLLNFILYSHLFFGRLYTENKHFDENFLPKNMNWMSVISEAWLHLKSELMKEKINDIELFMNYIFFDIYNILNIKKIDTYNKLINLENEIEKIISQKIKQFKK